MLARAEPPITGNPWVTSVIESIRQPAARRSQAEFMKEAMYFLAQHIDAPGCEHRRAQDGCMRGRSPALRRPCNQLPPTRRSPARRMGNRRGNRKHLKTGASGYRGAKRNGIRSSPDCQTPGGEFIPRTSTDRNLRTKRCPSVASHPRTSGRARAPRSGQ